MQRREMRQVRLKRTERSEEKSSVRLFVRQIEQKIKRKRQNRMMGKHDDGILGCLHSYTLLPINTL